MKPDIYTKTVLTIIAICLVILAGKSLDSASIISTAHAESKSVVDVNIVQINGERVNAGAVHPNNNGPSLPINIQSISGENFRKSLPVTVIER